ncbi:MAG: UDP-2,3-diacylglucosamine diphosphatase [Azovibrio sp.]|nr:UDP-2,3-diacylglucosamine diphosphatase [Azovibrio sp.]
MIHFISDLHLSPRTPGAARIFRRFLADIARPGNSLYILGDCFETWVGDDDMDAPGHRDIVAALAEASAAGLAIFLLHGNRDFLLGPDFALATGLTLLPDPYVLSTPEWQFVLSHGDALCTDDISYQHFRAQTRNPDWQAAFLARPLAERHAIAEHLRQQSEAAKSEKSAYLMDLNPGATDDFLRLHGYATFIHGHTHRPATHDHIVDGIHVERWVLADWHETQGETLRWNGVSLERQALYA